MANSSSFNAHSKPVRYSQALSPLTDKLVQGHSTRNPGANIGTQAPNCVLVSTASRLAIRPQASQYTVLVSRKILQSSELEMNSGLGVLSAGTANPGS